MSHDHRIHPTDDNAGDRQRVSSGESGNNSPLLVIGWREWVTLPDLRIRSIKAKIDTGARSSSLHAFDIESFDRECRQWVRFKVHPDQRREARTIACEALVHDIRSVRSSSGEASERFVIQTTIAWMGLSWSIDLTLAARFEMGFRMLIGREAIRNRMLVDAGRSYFGPKPRRKTR
jgi:hypothetical protein